MGLSAVQALLVASGLFLVWRVLVRKSSFANIRGPPKASWWKGNFHQIFNKYAWKFHLGIVEKYGSVVKIHMPFGDEQLYVADPLAIHHIAVKDQYIYEETSVFIATNALVFGQSLLSTLGDHHKKQRKMLNPVFSLKHMRDLVPIFYPIAYELRDVLAKVARSGKQEINVLEYMSKAALEYIGQGGLGYSFNALNDETGSRYKRTVENLGSMLFTTLLPRQILPWVIDLGSPKFRRKVLECIPSQVIKDAIVSVDYVENQSVKIFKEKKAAFEKGDETVQRQVGGGKDIMSVLLKANLEAAEGERLPEAELIGQMNTFILAGQDTTSHAITRILDQLVSNPDVQTRIRDEFSAARKENGGADLDYDTLMGLPYLDAVCRETLRLFPPVSMLLRTTRKDVVMPLAWPILGADGKTEIKEIPIKKNTGVIISILNINRSKKIWGEDAEEWKPERWLKPLPESVSKAHLPGVYSSMMTFHGGGRACIGFKFAEIEMKLVLTILLETFVFHRGSEIDWVMTGIAKPVARNSSSPQLPLKLSFVKDKN